MNHLRFFLAGIFCLSLNLVAKEIFAQDRDVSNYVQSIDNYDSISTYLKSLQKDTTHFKKLLVDAQDENHLLLSGCIANELGNIMRDFSNYPRSINYHSQALDYGEKTGNLMLRIAANNMMGVTYRRMDAIQSAMDFHQKALTLAEAAAPSTISVKRQIAISLNSIGNIYVALRQYEPALEIFARSKRIEQRFGNRLGLAINNQNMGSCYEELGRIAEAENAYKASLKYNREIKSKLGEVICYNSLARLYFSKKNEADKAVAMLEEIKPKAEALGDNYYVATTYINLGKALQLTGNTERAKTYLQKALNISTVHHLRLSRSEALKFLSELYFETGEYNKAYYYLKSASDADDSVVNEKSQQYISDLLIKYESEKKANDINNLQQENVRANLRSQRNLSLLFGVFGLLILSIAIGRIIFLHTKLKNQKERFGLEQQLMRSQMNPHFLFNALNAIKNSIIAGRSREANMYLSDFSKLLRKILNTSTQKTVSLEEELETLKQYVHLENARLETPINYSVHVDDSVDLSEINIPVLLLQPFVENAIWHGLSTVTNKEKEIIISVTAPDDDNIHIQIADNGIGLDASKKMNEARSPNHKSFGTSLAKRRHSYFTRNQHQMQDIDLRNRVDESGKVIGTVVDIDLPIKADA